jgi:organic hydroperoxide reductase OsmC/OhrA
MAQHDYTTRILWTGNRGEGTAHYKAYDRTWDIAVPGKAVVHCSNDPLLGGDPGKMNPEDLLLSALSACHMLWYLHYASDAGIVVTGYSDSPVGVGEVGRGGAGRFVRATLRPHVTVRGDGPRRCRGHPPPHPRGLLHCPVGEFSGGLCAQL